ncbi:MAG: hypothetical protein H0U12_03165 [Thermoleophilaceae bacterium]|jgi:hypothetical protein|nr:hypothetical protein [Thermoleophilaceae bacterium]
MASESGLEDGIGIAQNDPGEARASSSGSAGSTDERRTVSSTGTATLFFKIDKPSSFVWKNAKGKPFLAQGRGISIASSRGRGEAKLPPGRYSVFVSGAAWTVAVHGRHTQRSR